MPCGVTKTIAGGVVVTCDNPGTSTHSGLHAGPTKKFWMNWGYTVRVSWSSLDLSPARQKPIIRGDFGEVSPVASYREDFTDTPDNSGLGELWQAVVGQFRAFGGVAIPGNLGSNTGTTSFAALYTGGNNFGRVKTDDVSVTVRLVTTTRSLATNMRSSIILRCSDVFDNGTRVELNMTSGSGSFITTWNGSSPSQRATGGSVPLDSTVEFQAIGNYYAGYLNGSTTPFIFWTDTSGLMLTGDLQRRWGIATQSNFPLFQRQFDSHGIDWVETTDVAA